MKCQILFSGKNKKNNIILSSAENAQRVVKVNFIPSQALGKKKALFYTLITCTPSLESAKDICINFTI